MQKFEMLPLRGAGRLLGALSCLRSLTADVELLPSLAELESCVAPQRFCYVHLSLDPLPASASVALCLAEACSIPQLTDLFSLVCTLPSCSVLHDLALPPEAADLVRLCGPLQRMLCGPLDRTQMEHDVDLTCVAPHAAGADARRLHALAANDLAASFTAEAAAFTAETDEIDDARNNDNMFLNGLKHLLWDEVARIMKDFKSKYWQDGLEDDWRELKDALARFMHQAATGDQLDTGLLDLERAFGEVADDLTTSTQQLATDFFDLDNTLLADFWDDFVKDARNATSLKALSHALEQDFRRSIERHREKAHNRLQNITTHVHDWLETERTRLLNDSAVARAIDKLQVDIKRLEGDAKDSVRNNVEDALDRMRDLVHKTIHRRVRENYETTASPDTATATSAMSTRATHASMASPLEWVHELADTIWRLVDKLRKKDIEGAKAEHDEAINQLEQLADTVRTQFEDTVVEEFDSFVNTAKDTLNKWLHTTNPDNVDRSAIILLTRLSELTSFDKLHDKHTRPFSHSLESVVMAAEVFVDDLVTLATRRVADLASDELLQRDLTKLDRKVSSLISAARSEFKTQYVNQWIDFKKKLEVMVKRLEAVMENPKELQEALESVVKSLGDFIKRIKDDHLHGMMDNLVRDHPLLNQHNETWSPVDLIDHVMDIIIKPLVPDDTEYPHRRLADAVLSSFEGKQHSFAALSWLPFTLDILQHIKPRLDVWAQVEQRVEERKEFLVSNAEMQSLVACGSSTFRNPKALLLSGHTVQSVGDYYGCLEEPHAQYCLIKGAGMISQGRCLNEKACSPERLEELSAFVCRWVREGRSCFELTNIVPPDYCVFVKVVGCGLFDEVPAMTNSEITKMLGMRVKHPHVDYWWSSDYSGPAFLGLLSNLLNSTTFVEQIKLSRHLILNDPASVWGSLPYSDMNTLPYNISKVAEDLGYPILEHHCSDGRETYWTGSRVVVAGLLLVVFFALPLAALYTGTSDSRQRRGERWSPVTKVLSAFHFIENYYIWSAPTEKVPTSSIHGMRVISMYWILLGHTLSSVFLTNALQNYMATIDLIHSAGMQLVMGAVFGVDTFFCFSGFLLGLKAKPSLVAHRHHHHHVVHERHHHGWAASLVETVKGFFKRWLRLSPTYYLVLLVWVIMVPDLVSAPFYKAFSDTIAASCRGTWPTHLLYVDNLQSDVDSCMGWSWYIAVDMQLFLVGLLLTRLYYHSKRAFIHTWVIIFVLASTWCFIEQLQNHFTLGQMSLSVVGDVTLDTDIHTATQKQLNYIRPYPRMMGYLAALWLGLWMKSHRILDTSKKEESSPPEITEHRTPLLEKANDAEQLASPWIESEEKNCRLTDTPRQADTAHLLRSRHNHAAEEDASRTDCPARVHILSKPKFWRQYAVPGHLVALALMTLIVYLPYLNYVRLSDSLPYFVTVIYNIYARLVWVACVLWFVVTCMAVHAGVCGDRLSSGVNGFLSCSFFAYLAPLVYGAYLLHMGLQTAYYAHVPTTAFISLAEGFHESLAWAPLTFALAFVLHLAVELPLARLVAPF